jgi:hypothetical protein
MTSMRMRFLLISDTHVKRGHQLLCQRMTPGLHLVV